MNSAFTLNLVLYFPLLGALLIACLPRDRPEWTRNAAVATSVLTFVISLGLWADFNRADNAQFQFLTAIDWIPQLGIQYKVGADGVSLSLVMLTTILSFVAILSSWSSVTTRSREYYIFLLILETGMLGVFTALDLVLFYIFWEVSLIPMYFLIGIWGGPRRQYATIKFVLYTLVGALLMLAAIVWVYIAAAQAGQPTFDLEILAGPNSPLSSGSTLDPNIRMGLFLAFALAFAVKVPMFPLHTWLPDAHVEAPTAGSVILAGVLLKMGTYGFLRFAIPLFPEEALRLAPIFMALSVIGIIYGALMAYVQTDVKRLVAYSSVSHLGFCMLGLFSFTREGVAGAVLQMINHGLSTGALFLLVGMIYERRHTREIKEFGGLWRVMPVFGLFLLITMLSSVGLPGLNGFVGEFYVLLGTWGRVTAEQPFSAPWAAILASSGVILGAIYMLWMFQRMMQGPIDHEENRKLKDLNAREILTLAPLVAGMFWIGIAPMQLLGIFDQSIASHYVQPMVDAHTRVAASKAGAPPGGMPGGLPGGMPGGLPGGMPGGLPGGMPGGLPPGRPGSGLQVRPGGTGRRPAAPPRAGAGAARRPGTRRGGTR